MRLHLIAVGQRLPAWIQQGFSDFNTRLPKEYKLHLREIETAKRHKNSDVDRLLHEECDQIIKAVPKNTKIIALHVAGKIWTTEDLAGNLQHWAMAGENIAFMVGGPDGLSAHCLNRAEQTWSLSKLTFPHGLVRIILIEQIYRAWTITQGHPYHR